MKTRNIVLGTILLVLGAFLLLYNLGLVQINIFRLIQFWPLVLIAMGLGVLLGHRFSKVIVLLIVAGVVALTVLTIEFGGAVLGSGEVVASGVVGPDIEQVEYILDVAGLKLNIASEDLGDDAVIVDYSGYKPELKHRRQGDNLVVEIDQPKRLAKLHGHRWNVQLSNAKPLALELNMGATDAEVNLEDVTLARLEVACGAGNLEFKLPPKGAGSLVEVDVNVGGGSIEIDLPDSAAVMIEYDKALGTHNLTEQGFVKDGKGYYSRLWNRDEAEVVYQIHIGSALSDLEIDWYETR